MGNAGPILSGRYLTLQVFMCPIFTNIPMILANFLDTIIQIFRKTLAMTVGTLIAGQLFVLQAKMAWKYPTKYHQTPIPNLGEWAIASHGKGTRPCRKVADVDIKCQFPC